MNDIIPSGIIKIAVVGPESTGKSTMSILLANHYNTVSVPEYAREYCENLNREYTWQDELNMFYGQLELEEKLLPEANKLLICDTTFITIKIWSDHLFGHSPVEVIDKLQKHPYHFYLLMNIDLPWEDDPLRDFPHLREHFMQVWHKELKLLKTPYQVISGTGHDRFLNAVRATDEFLNQISSS